MPLSFRGNGAFVISSKGVFDFSQQVIPENLSTDIQKIFSNINNQVDKLQSTISDLDSFVKYVEQNPTGEDQWFDSNLIIMASIIQKEYDKTLSLLDYAKKENKISGFGFGGKSFYDLAREYCQSHL
jgi:hypothetical protein